MAEGFCRFHYKDRLNFYYDARGSAGEVQSQVLDGKDLEFIEKGDFESIWSQTEKVILVVSGLIRKTQELSKR